MLLHAPAGANRIDTSWDVLRQADGIAGRETFSVAWRSII